MKTIAMKTVSSLALGLLVAGSLLPVAARAQTCTSLEALVDRALPPEAGDATAISRLLSARATSFLGQSFLPSRAQASVGDSLVADASCPPFQPLSSKGQPFQCVYKGSTGSKLRVDLGEGKVVYLNGSRSLAQTPISLSETTAMSIASQAASSFGVPLDELSHAEAGVRALRISDKDGASGAASSRRAELHVRYPRRVAGTLVADSGLHVAVNAQGQVARMHVRWPDFHLEPGLSASRTRPRADVRNQLVADIAAHNACGAVSAVKVTVAYVPTRGLDQGDRGDDEGTSTSRVPVDAYAPALLVQVIPVEQAEDSGVPQEAGELLYVPLVATAL